ncbi:MAG: PKD domain-containing protein [Candidatus Omnitrophica bacterium]|nr:PKD domain-containing protein [Candidatus Omnitrophota bacterium]
MKKAIALLLFSFLLSGCVTYKFQQGKAPYDKGYVVTRSGYQIPEYTVGKNNAVPDLDVAKERFKRRRKTVESYYMNMGIIESRLKEYLWNPPVTIVKVVGGIFRMPFVMANDRKYERDPKYRAEVNKNEDEDFEKEKARIKALREELNIYVEKDLLIEEQKPEVKAVPPPEVKAVPQPEVKVVPTAAPEAVPAEGAKPAQPPVEPVAEKIETPPPPETKPPVILSAPVPVIVARPMKGFSPLKVQFYATQSHSANGRIVSYEWDFGDGDTSRLAKPVNTYLSATYGSRIFTVTLTVTDAKAQTASTTASIEVLTK